MALLARINHPLTILPGPVAAAIPTLLWFGIGDCGSLPQVRVNDHASCHRDCRDRQRPRRLFLVFLDAFKSAPPTVQVQLDLAPPGADATTSLGPGCKTPCSVNVPAPDAGFSVTFTLPKFQPVTVPVQVIRNPGDFSTPPPPRSIPSGIRRTASRPARHRRRASRSRKSRSRRTAAAAPAASPFPNPPPPPPCHRCAIACSRTRTGLRIVAGRATCLDCDCGAPRHRHAAAARPVCKGAIE